MVCGASSRHAKGKDPEVVSMVDHPTGVLYGYKTLPHSSIFFVLEVQNRLRSCPMSDGFFTRHASSPFPIYGCMRA